MIDLLREHRKTVVLIGDVNSEGEWSQWATGFLVALGGVLHLVTAKHVVRDPTTGEPRDHGMTLRYNRVGGGHRLRSLDEVKEQRGVEWVFHQDDEVDVAVLPVPLDRQADDVMVIPEDLFLQSDQLFELLDIFFLTFQPEIELAGRITPVVRGGLISLINEDSTFFIDSFAFPGNSGSPVFVKRTPGRVVGEGNIRFGGDALADKLIGVVGAYVPYRERAISAQTGQTRVIFEENTGLSRVWSVSFVREIAQSQPCRRQIHRLTEEESPGK
jgi:hypothetical protein